MSKSVFPVCLLILTACAFLLSGSACGAVHKPILDNNTHLSYEEVDSIVRVITPRVIHNDLGSDTVGIDGSVSGGAFHVFESSSEPLLYVFAFDIYSAGGIVAVWRADSGLVQLQSFQNNDDLRGVESAEFYDTPRGSFLLIGTRGRAGTGVQWRCWIVYRLTESGLKQVLSLPRHQEYALGTHGVGSFATRDTGLVFNSEEAAMRFTEERYIVTDDPPDTLNFTSVPTTLYFWKDHFVEALFVSKEVNPLAIHANIGDTLGIRYQQEVGGCAKVLITNGENEWEFEARTIQDALFFGYLEPIGRP